MNYGIYEVLPNGQRKLVSQPMQQTEAKQGAEEKNRTLLREGEGEHGLVRRFEAKAILNG